MKQRVISAIVMAIVVIPFVLKGGLVFNFGMYVVALLGLREFIKIKEMKKQLPSFIYFISIVMLTIVMFSNYQNLDMVYKMDYRLLAGLFACFLVPLLIYHNKELYSVNDAFFMMGSIFFLGIAFQAFIIVRNIGIEIFIYLLSITIITDTFAYLTGLLIGRNKLLETISPKKTWEGLIGGTIMGVFIPVVFYHTVINASLSIWVLIAITLFFSILGQFGDLVFSAIKRYYGKKDFSNLIPGHGGILDRLDSLIFVLLGFMFFINIL